MAKETMIVFVYDTERLKDETDDPVNAVLYFHPSWVSDTQKLALCGQLMGTSFFLRDCFFKPRILALQNGKFILKEFGRFILAVGTDRNISDYILQYRSDLLSSLVRLFHRDLQTIHEQFAFNAQYKNLTEKLYHIFETYLPILQHKGNIYNNIPKLRLPKPASNIFLDAIQTLQCCQQTKGVLGGAILYHNKVIATQLGDEITKQLLLTDPLHVRTTAEQLNSADFHIPNGVQMIVVYIDAAQYRQLAADAQRAQSVHLQLSQNGAGTALPFFQCAKRKIRRDQSLIFTNIPEEHVASITTTADCAQAADAEVTATGGRESGAANGADNYNAPWEQLTHNAKVRAQVRPTHLPLRFKNATSREPPESGIASVNFDESDSFPEFIGRTSICSTPMTENKVLQMDSIVSICAGPDSKVADSTAEAATEQQRSSLKMDFESFFKNFISNPNKLERRSNSFVDLQDTLKSMSKKLAFKQNPKHSAKTDDNQNGNGSTAVTPANLIECGDKDSVASDSSGDSSRTCSHTITDPTNPVFNASGQPISRSLFQEFLERYHKLWESNSNQQQQQQQQRQQQAEVTHLIAEFKEFDKELRQLNDTLCNTTTTKNITDRNCNTEKGIKTPLDKKALSLPLKPLTSDAAASSGDAKTLPTAVVVRRPSGGIPLTPLMAKLSVLALNEERSTVSGFCSWDTTPAAVTDAQTPLDASKAIRRRSSNTANLKCDEALDALLIALPANSISGNKGDELQRVELYMCGQQNMTLLLLLEQGSCSKQPIVQDMFDICVAKFPHMESHLNRLLNISAEGDKSDVAYSFVCIDDKWDALQQSGAWNPVELNTLESMHSDLQTQEGVTDVILRAHDNIFYGYKCGRREFIYKEAANHTSGIPAPADPMGSVLMRAKTRLERDHSYVLL